MFSCFGGSTAQLHAGEVAVEAHFKQYIKLLKAQDDDEEH